MVRNNVFLGKVQSFTFDENSNVTFYCKSINEDSYERVSITIPMKEFLFQFPNMETFGLNEVIFNSFAILSAPMIDDAWDDISFFSYDRRDIIDKVYSSKRGEIVSQFMDTESELENREVLLVAAMEDGIGEESFDKEEWEYMTAGMNYGENDSLVHHRCFKYYDKEGNPIKEIALCISSEIVD